MADSMAMAPAPAAISLADVAGKWSVRATMPGTDSTVITYELNATTDMNGWTIQLPDRPAPEPVRVTLVDADSIVVESGPFASALRPGTQVTTRGVSRLENGQFVGMMVARYNVTTADSVVTLHTVGTRVP